MIGDAALRSDLLAIYSNSTVAGHKYDQEDGEFQLILNSLNKNGRNEIYDAVRNTVNELNKAGNYSLTSIGLPKQQEILAISGVAHEHIPAITQSIVNAMEQRSRAYNLPNSGSSQTIAVA